MIIRKLESADLAPCIDLFIAVFNRPPWNNEWTYAAAERLFMDFYRTPGFAGYVACNAEQEILGAIIGKTKQWWRGEEYVIEEFYIRSELQGQGIGTRLLDFVYEDMRTKGVATVTLLTSTNAPAYAFYRNKQYQENTTLRLLYKSVPSEF